MSGAQRPLLAQTLLYAKTHRVIPIDADKKPLIPLARASQSEDVISEWVAELQPAGIGLRTDRLVVLDVAPGAEAELARLELERGLLPVTREQRTPSGGHHLLYRLPAGASLEPATLAPGVNLIAGPGRYVVVPPSRNGQGAYAWITPDGAKQPAPLVDFAPEWAASPTERAPVQVPEQRGGVAEGTAESPRESDATPGRPTEAKHTDLGNAVLFAEMHGDRLRHLRESRSWYAWRDGRWRRDTTGHAQRAAKDTARQLWEEAYGDDAAVKWAISSQQETRLRAMLEVAASEPGIALAADDFDRDPFLLACGNGTLDLRTGKLRAHDPADLISLGNEIDYDPDAACPLWQKFLHEVFDGDAELVSYIKRVIGYMLTGDSREQVVFVFHGAGCNGKGTLIERVKLLLGKGLGETAPFETFTRTRADRGPRNDIARLHRSRMVVASESGAGHKLDEAVVKNLSGSDTIAARFLYGEFFEFKPQFKIVLVSNHKPQVDGDDDAIWRRIRLIPFHVSFLERKDLELSDKLERELPGILTWAVQGCLEWQRDGLGSVASVTEATREYRAEEDTLGAFLDDRCTPSGTVISAELREAYEAYCVELGEKPLAANVLGRQLRKRGIQPKAGRIRTYQGISLRGTE